MSNAVNSTIAHITEVVMRVTRILSGKQIKVVQQGMKVGVEYDPQGRPTVVYLPSLTENPSPELLVAIQGFLDKEVSTLLYTDFDARHKYKQTAQFKRGMAKSLQEIIEDARTEREMRRQFRGSATNFDKNHDFAIKDIIAPALAEASTPDKQAATLAFPAIRAACGDYAYEEFMDGKWESLGKLGGAILHYADEIQNAASTEDTFNLTRKIIQKMEESESDDDDQGDDDDGEGEGDVGEGACGVGDAAADGDGDGDSAEGAGDTKPPPQEQADLSRENKSKNLNEAKQARPSGHSGTSQGLDQFKDIDSAFEDVDFDKKAQEKIKKIAGLDASKSGAYVPFSRQYDYVGPWPRAQEALRDYARSSHAQQILTTVDTRSHVIQQQIQRLFMARELVRWEPGQRKGKLNPTALYRLPQGDPKIFRRKIETNGRDVAVSLVIDMSGSMSGSKIQNAIIAALMFSKVLTNLGIKHEISSFTTYHGSGGRGMPDSEEVSKMMRDASEMRYGHSSSTPYARYAPLVNFILKGFDERLREETRRVISMIPSTSGYMANNVDGESVEVAGRRLLQQKEKKKVMIVMSDGQPAADGYGADLVSHLKQVVKNLSDAGVEMLGLGLQDTSVKRFYPKSEVVLQTDEIPSKILELTRRMVIGV